MCLSWKPTIYESWSTSELRVRLACHETGLNLPVKYFYWPFLGGTSFVDHLCYLYLVCLSCFRVCEFLRCCHLKGKGWPLVSCLWCLLWFCYFPIWYPETGVVLNCIDSWSLLSFLLQLRSENVTIENLPLTLEFIVDDINVYKVMHLASHLEIYDIYFQVK